MADNCEGEGIKMDGNQRAGSIGKTITIWATIMAGAALSTAGEDKISIVERVVP